MNEESCKLILEIKKKLEIFDFESLEHRLPVFVVESPFRIVTKTLL